MNDGKPAAAYIFAVLVENVRLLFPQTLGIHTLNFGGYPRYLIARCCTISGILHLQLDLLLDSRFLLFHLLDLVGKLLSLVQQITDGIQIGSFVSIICRVQLIDLLCIPLASGRYRWNFGHHVVFPEVLFFGNEIVQNFFVGCDLVNALCILSLIIDSVMMKSYSTKSFMIVEKSLANEWQEPTHRS